MQDPYAVRASSLLGIGLVLVAALAAVGLTPMNTPLASLPPGDHLCSISSTLDGSAQPYRLFIPDAMSNGERVPLVVALHGKGVDHHAWFELTTIKQVAGRRGWCVAAPNGRGKAYYNDAGEQDVLDIIDVLIRELPIDPQRVYLVGHSMGGWGTWHIALRHPQRFASICAMAAPQPDVSLEAARGLDPFIIHDAGDTVVPVAKSRKVAAELAALGISYRYREETGYGHQSKMISANLERVFDWFAVHRANDARD